jgi:hypothetical protein
LQGTKRSSLFFNQKSFYKIVVWLVVFCSC